MRAQITLKSGAQIEVDVEKIETVRNSATNELTKLTWTTPDEYSAKLLSITLDQIVAVVILRPATS